MSKQLAVFPQKERSHFCILSRSYMRRPIIPYQTPVAYLFYFFTVNVSHATAHLFVLLMFCSTYTSDRLFEKEFSLAIFHSLCR